MTRRSQRYLLWVSVTSIALLAPLAWGQADKGTPSSPVNGGEFKCTEGPLLGIAFSPDGKWLAATAARSVTVWDTATRKQLAQYLAAPSWFTAVCCFSPDGKYLATGSDDGTVLLWDTASGHTARTLVGHHRSVIAVGFQTDGKRLASVSGIRPWLALESGGEVKLWDRDTGKELRSFRVPSHDRERVAFAADGKRLAGVGFDKKLRVWEVDSGKQLLAVAGAGGVCFSPDGRNLATWGDKGAIVLWEMLTGKERLRLPLAPASYGGPLAFSLDGKHLAAVTLESKENERGQLVIGSVLKVWYVLRGQVTHTRQHGGPLVLAFRPGSADMAIGIDGSVVLWKNSGGRK